jgi:murein DD-endopeptidase MepM/ murein hydrolase activator NlpD
MSHKLGLHWIRVHPDGRDYSHIERMQYPSVKQFEWHWNNRDACRDLLAVLPRDAYILARDHPLSEQKQDMWNDPVGTGTRHANEWAMKVASGNYHMPVERTFFLGINEPDATNGDRAAIDRYTAAFLNRLRVHGLRGGAFNFSTGHPRTKDGTGNTKADYSVFEESHQAIVAGHHIAVAHIYGSSATPCVPGHYDRLWACDWQDVQWVIGEAGADEHVTTGGAHDGYLRTMNPPDYCRWLDELIMGVNDPRIHSYQVFTYDFSHPWDSFDVRPIRDALEGYDWQHAKQKHTTHIPIVGTPPQPVEPPASVPPLTHPIADPNLRVISQPFGVNPDRYARFGMAGHNGVDYAIPEGTNIRAVDDGEIVEAGFDADGYGRYQKMRHTWGESLYAHLSLYLHGKGARVKAGEPIALSGNTGNSTGPHLHFGMRVNPYTRGWPFDGYTDPLPYLSGAAQPSPQPAPLLPLIKAAAQEFGIEWQLLASQAWAESSFDPRAVSSAGAQGLMQIMPATWAEWSPKVGGGNDPFDARQNLRVGAAYMQWLLKQTGGIAWNALVAYGWGIGDLIGPAPVPAIWQEYANKIIHGRDLLKAVGQ